MLLWNYDVLLSANYNPFFYQKLRLLIQSRHLFPLRKHWQVNHAIFFSILKEGKHGVIDGRWVCGQCGKSLSSPSGLDQHIQTVHGAYILPCDHCDLKFKRKDHVRKTKNQWKPNLLFGSCHFRNFVFSSL